MRLSVFAAAMTAVTWIGTLAAQDIKLANLSSIPRKQWIDVALPAVDAAPLPRLCRFDPQGWIAFKGRAIGQHSVLFHVLANLAPNQTCSGRLVGVSNSPATFAPWAMSDWVADNTIALLPRPVLLDTNGVEHRLRDPRLELVEDASPARRVFHISGRIGTTPMAFDAYLYVYAGQDVVEIECTLTCADPRLPGMNYGFQLLWLESGEYLNIDYHRRLGLIAPFRQTQVPSHPSYNRWIQLLSGLRKIGRGEGLHLSGALLCMCEPGHSPTSTSYATNGMSMQWSVGNRVDQLFAEHEQPCVGLWQHWEGKWLAFGMVPEVPIPFRGDGGVADSNASWAGFTQLMQQPADQFVQRPRGLLRYAPSTGAQEDFGACKGAFAVTVGDPRWIHDAGYSVTEAMMRGFHYREIDGTPMRAANHPLLRCFNQVVHCVTTQDRVGYPCPIPYGWASNGWSAWDEQHRSQNNFNAMLALTGRFALRDQLRDLAEVDKAAVANWMNSPRAEGRLTIAWANMLLLMEDPADRQALLQCMLTRIQTVQNLWPGGQFVGNPNKPIHAIEVGSDPSFLEPGSVDKRVPAFITWEHSIAVMGFYAAWRVTGEQRYYDMAKDISRVIVDHCTFLENGHWMAATAIRYLRGVREGDALPASAYYTGSPDVHASTVYWPWILPSVLICRELNTGTNPTRVARCNAILADVAPNGPNDWRTAEWWAVLPR
jgi:hypothetical protein